MGKFIGYGQEHEEALYIRKEFVITKPIRKAELKLSALGVVKGYCNGEEIDHDLLTPGWTDYHKRIPFYTFDVTDRLKEGENALAFTLGNGWAIGKIAWFGKKHYGTQPLLWCELQLEFEDGTVACIESNTSFKVSFGQVRDNDIFDGEVWDARRDLGDFSVVGYDDHAWEWAVEQEGYVDLLEEAVNPLTKKMETMEGIYLYERNGYRVYDFGQNHAGVPEVFISDAEEGTKLTFIYGEMLDEDGSIYKTNLRSAKATDFYICRYGKQEFLPQMTFHGYRYMGILVEGKCIFEQVKSRLIYSDIPFYSTFECSDGDVNQLFRNVINSQKSNFINVPTDCPQRDERLGWTGDAQVFCRSAMFNADCRKFFRKFLIDVMDAQWENGMIDSVAPTVALDFDEMLGSPAWGDVITILPYEYYCVYKDTSIIELTLDSAKRWVQYCVGQSENYIRPARAYGDWLSINETTDNTLLGTLYMAYSALLVSRMCEITGDGEASLYADLFTKIKKAIRDTFVLEDYTLSSDSQTAYCLAYTFEIMTAEEIRPHLLDSLRRNNHHLSTGFVGVKYLLPVLCELGEYALAYEVFTQKDFPSWCYPVRNGATTIWERWDSYVKGRGFAPGMNSFNHYAFGSVCEWIFSMMLGIRYTENGLSICPVIDDSGRITWVKGSTMCREGRIAVAWKNQSDGWTELKVEKPENVELDLSKYRVVKKVDIDTYLIQR